MTVARTDQELKAAYEFVDSIVNNNDGKLGDAPFWHGWALREAFLKGIDYQRLLTDQRDKN